MELEIIYSYAKAYKTFREFKAAVNDYMTGAPTTAESNNELQLIVKNCNATAVSKSEGLWDGALLLAFRDHLSKKYDKGSAFTLNDIADFLSQQ